MTTELTSKNDWTDEQLRLITNTVAKGASPDELKLFLYRCKNMGLDPLRPGQIYFVKYGNNPGTIVVGIEGFRARAASTGKLSGVSRGVLKDDKGKCVGAFAEIHRSDWQHPAREEVSLAEYNTGKGNWTKMPETMIKKVAECAALRMAFPDQLGGVYGQEEMEQADQSARILMHPVVPQQPEEGDGVIDHPSQGYRIPFGKFKQRSLEEVGVTALNGYVTYLQEQSEKQQKPITGQVSEFIDLALNFIHAHEPSPKVQPEPVMDHDKEGWSLPQQSWKPKADHVPEKQP